MSIDTIAVWHQVAKNRNIEGLYDLLDENAVFHSPVVHSPQVGKQITGKYLSAAFTVFLMIALFTFVRFMVKARLCLNLKLSYRASWSMVWI